MRGIILIGWSYIVILFALASHSLARGINIVLFLGLLPTFLFLWTGMRRARLRREAAAQAAGADVPSDNASSNAAE